MGPGGERRGSRGQRGPGAEQPDRHVRGAVAPVDDHAQHDRRAQDLEHLREVAPRDDAHPPAGPLRIQEREQLRVGGVVGEAPCGDALERVRAGEDLDAADVTGHDHDAATVRATAVPQLRERLVGGSDGRQQPQRLVDRAATAAASAPGRTGHTSHTCAEPGAGPRVRSTGRPSTWADVGLDDASLGSPSRDSRPGTAPGRQVR